MREQQGAAADLPGSGGSFSGDFPGGMGSMGGRGGGGFGGPGSGFGAPGGGFMGGMGMGSMDRGDPSTTNLYVGNLAPEVSRAVYRYKGVYKQREKLAGCGAAAD